MSRKQLKAKAMDCIVEMAMARDSNNHKMVRRWSGRLFDICEQLAEYGYIGAQGWYNRFTA